MSLGTRLFNIGKLTSLCCCHIVPLCPWPCVGGYLGCLFSASINSCNSWPYKPARLASESESESESECQSRARAQR